MTDWENVLARSNAQAKRGEGGFTCAQICDLTKIGSGDEFSLVVAVDDDRGIGSHTHDLVKVSEYVYDCRLYHSKGTSRSASAWLPILEGIVMPRPVSWAACVVGLPV